MKVKVGEFHRIENFNRESFPDSDKQVLVYVDGEFTAAYFSPDIGGGFGWDLGSGFNHFECSIGEEWAYINKVDDEA
jgi:hypothetical protein